MKSKNILPGAGREERRANAEELSRQIQAHVYPGARSSTDPELVSIPGQ
jgi:hypothetical protein